MAVYTSKYATRGVPPRPRRHEFPRLRRAWVRLGAGLLLAATAVGLWRATFGVPDPPGLISGG